MVVLLGMWICECMPCFTISILSLSCSTGQSHNYHCHFLLSIQITNHWFDTVTSQSSLEDNSLNKHSLHYEFTACRYFSTVMDCCMISIFYRKQIRKFPLSSQFQPPSSVSRNQQIYVWYGNPQPVQNQVNPKFVVICLLENRSSTRRWTFLRTTECSRSTIRMGTTTTTSNRWCTTTSTGISRIMVSFWCTKYFIYGRVWKISR